MGSEVFGHSTPMAVTAPDLLEFRATEPSPASETAPRLAQASFHDIYVQHVDLVWRGLRGLGVAESAVEDATQDVFIVVHRRLHEFEARSSFRTWLYGIVLRVARNYRRTEQRKGGCASLDGAPEIPDVGPSPQDEAATAQALRELAIVLAELDEPKREVFVLAELEQMSAPEIADALGIKVNTVYSRLRAARMAFDAAVLRRKGGLR